MSRHHREQPLIRQVVCAECDTVHMIHGETATPWHCPECADDH
jgi:ribosomal protein S27E